MSITTDHIYIYKSSSTVTNMQYLTVFTVLMPTYTDTRKYYLAKFASESEGNIRVCV